MAEQIQRNNVSFVGGDFNMALFVAKDELKAYGIDAVFLGSYAWRQKDTRGSGVEGLPGCRYDSLALFAVRLVSTISRLLRQAALRGIGARDLDEFEDAHGYPSSSTSAAKRRSWLFIRMSAPPPTVVGSVYPTSSRRRSAHRCGMPLDTSRAAAPTCRCSSMLANAGAAPRRGWTRAKST